GQVVGSYADANGASHAFVVAVPEPASLILMAGGVAGVVLATAARVRSRIAPGQGVLPGPDQGP
ncbi:MAG: PEP-CTERM sorting domain-containing protein, partial [Isosphaeraceae bacterium]